jgi:hypothetical protein
MSVPDYGCIKHRCIHLYGTDCIAVTGDSAKFETATITNLNATNISGRVGISDVLKSWGYHNPSLRGGFTLPLPLDPGEPFTIDCYSTELEAGVTSSGFVQGWGAMVTINIGLTSTTSGSDDDRCALNVSLVDNMPNPPIGYVSPYAYEDNLDICIRSNSTAYFTKSYYCGPNQALNVNLSGANSGAPKLTSYSSFAIFTLGPSPFCSISQNQLDYNKTQMVPTEYDG